MFTYYFTETDEVQKTKKCVWVAVTENTSRPSSMQASRDDAHLLAHSIVYIVIRSSRVLSVAFVIASELKNRASANPDFGAHASPSICHFENVFVNFDATIQGYPNTSITLLPYIHRQPTASDL